MSPPTPRLWLLRHADQSAVALIVLMFVVAISGWRVVQGGLQNRFVEADQTQHRVARFQVDINTADRPELLQLPGIGETLANRIIETRRTAGPFTAPDELRKVRGIGPKITERLRPYILPLPNDNKTKQINIPVSGSIN